MVDKAAPDPLLLRHVSYHAVLRFVQRIVGVTVETPAHFNDKQAARVHAKAIGRSVTQIRAEILTPGVQLAVLSGFPEVATRRFRAFVSQPDGVITTIALPFQHNHRRLRLLSEPEHRKGRQRACRRSQRRPARIVVEAAE